MGHCRLACWITVALACASTFARADEANGSDEVGASWMGAVHVALPASGHDACWMISRHGLDDEFPPSRAVEGVVTIDGGAMRYAFDPSRAAKRIVTSQFGAGALGAPFGRLDAPPAMAVALGGGRSVTISLGVGSAEPVAARHCLGIDGVAADDR